MFILDALDILVRAISFGRKKLLQIFWNEATSVILALEN